MVIKCYFLLNIYNSTTALIPVSDKGKLQEAKWHPYGKEFVIIDHHPMRLTCYNFKGEKTHDFGPLTANIIRFSEDGKFMWTGGFGNLPGDMYFYDWDNKNKMIGINKDASCRYYEWTNDSNFFITARVAKYRTVDNGYKIYKYNGMLLYSQNYDRLYQVLIRSYPLKTFIKRDISPESLSTSKNINIKHEQKKAYIPPHLRSKSDNNNNNNHNNNQRKTTNSNSNSNSNPNLNSNKLNNKNNNQTQVQVQNIKNEEANENEQEENDDDEHDNDNKKKARRKRNKKDKSTERPAYNASDEPKWLRGSKIGQNINNNKNNNNNNNNSTLQSQVPPSKPLSNLNPNSNIYAYSQPQQPLQPYTYMQNQMHVQPQPQQQLQSQGYNQTSNISIMNNMNLNYNQSLYPPYQSQQQQQQQPPFNNNQNFLISDQNNSKVITNMHHIN